jgi:hypothetical protein
MDLCEHLKNKVAVDANKLKTKLKGFTYCAIEGSPFGQFEMLGNNRLPPCLGDPNSEECPYREI